MSLKKYKSRGKAVKVTVNRQEENFQDFCLDFVQEFGLRTGRIDKGGIFLTHFQ